MKALRTPDERFADLPDFTFEPHYAEVDAGDGEALRVHYIDEGPRDGRTVLLLHGEPTWSFMYRRVIDRIVAKGGRAVAPDLAGFGRSDKPAARSDYTYERHVEWVRSLIEQLDLEEITLVGHDWGGLIGLRLAAENEKRFTRILATNTFLPTGDMPLGDAFNRWKAHVQEVPELDIGRIMTRGCVTGLDPEVVAAYEAPFPDESYKEGARAFPLLVPATPDDPAAPANRKAWEVLMQWEKPFLTAFSDSDPITKGADGFLQVAIPGAQKRAHVTIEGAGHFVPEEAGDELGRITADFVFESD